MHQKAVIYIRTSSEAQGEKASPSEQEADCRSLAKEKELTVVRVYRDIEKYRVKNKLVEPSGLRSDRPGLLAMLKDAAIGEFDVILAWREDRLYRGLRSMLLVLEAIQQYKITILLAKGHFDPQIAPIRAWAAQMELESMQDRMRMGVIARLKAGKANTGQDRYGYVRIGEQIHILEKEAKWVRQIFAWYIQENSPDANSETIDRCRRSSKREQHSPTHPMVPVQYSVYTQVCQRICLWFQNIFPCRANLPHPS